jgi:hypothetical protein
MGTAECAMGSAELMGINGSHGIASVAFLYSAAPLLPLHWNGAMPAG